MEIPYEATRKIIAYLQRLAPGLTEDEILQGIIVCKSAAESIQRNESDKAALANARQAIRKAAESMLEAMNTVNLYSESNMEDPDRFKQDLEILVSEIPQRKKKPGARELSTVVKAAHQWAKTMLDQCGVKPTSGSSETAESDLSANVARLGAFLCSALGITLPKGESTKAARLACSAVEFLVDCGIRLAPEIEPEK